MRFYFFAQLGKKIPIGQGIKTGGLVWPPRLETANRRFSYITRSRMEALA